MSELVKVFENVEFGKIRVVIIDDEPWFVGKDLSEALGYSSASAMYKHVDEVDKRNIDPQSIEFIGSFQNGSILEPNQNIRKLTIINESGMYDSIFGSGLEGAKRFKKWVTSDLLPTLRKTGGYVVENRAIDFVSNWLPNLDDTSKNVIANMLEDNQKLRLENSKQKEVIEVQKPKAEYFDALVETNLLTSFRDTAKELKVKETLFIDFLLGKGYIFRDKRNKLKPSAQYVGTLFELKEFTTGKFSDVQTRVTPKGRETFRLLVDKFLK